MTLFPPLISRLIPSLARDNDNEVLTTVRAIGSALRGAGKDFHDLARAVGSAELRQPTPASRASTSAAPGSAGFSRVARHQARQAYSDFDKASWLAQYAEPHLSDREIEFIRDIERRLSRYGGHATLKQASWLDAIFARVARCAA